MGPVESAVRSDVAAMICRAPTGEALAELAYALAAMIDAPDADGMHRSPASVSRELRAVLEQLAAASVSGDDDDLAALLSGLPTALRDAT